MDLSKIFLFLAYALLGLRSSTFAADFDVHSTLRSMANFNKPDLMPGCNGQMLTWRSSVSCPRGLIEQAFLDESRGLLGTIGSPNATCPAPKINSSFLDSARGLEEYFISSNPGFNVGGGRLFSPSCLSADLRQGGAFSRGLPEKQKALVVAEFYYTQNLFKRGELSDIQAISSIEATLARDNLLQEINCEGLNYTENSARCKHLKTCKMQGKTRLPKVVSDYKSRFNDYAIAKKIIYDFQKKQSGGFRTNPQEFEAFARAKMQIQVLEKALPLFRGSIFQGAINAHVTPNESQMEKLVKDQLEANLDGHKRRLKSYSDFRKCIFSQTPLLCKNFYEFVESIPQIESQGGDSIGKDIDSYFSTVRCLQRTREKIANAESLAIDVGMTVGLTLASFGTSAAFTVAEKTIEVGARAARTANQAKKLRGYILALDTANVAQSTWGAIEHCNSSFARNIERSGEATSGSNTCPFDSQSGQQVVEYNNCLLKASLSIGQTLVPFAMPGLLKVANKARKVEGPVSYGRTPNVTTNKDELFESAVRSGFISSEIEHIANGGEHQVYMALVDGKKVAVRSRMDGKDLRPDELPGLSLLEKYSGPKVYGKTTLDGKDAIAMEFIKGVELKNTNKVTSKQCRQIMAIVEGAIGTSYHLWDLQNTRNILIDERGDVRPIDVVVQSHKDFIEKSRLELSRNPHNTAEIIKQRLEDSRKPMANRGVYGHFISRGGADCDFLKPLYQEFIDAP